MAIYLVFVIIYNDGIMINFCFNQPPHTHSPSFLSPFSLEPNAPSLTHFSVSPSPKKIKKNPLKISVADISSNFNPILSPRITHRPIGSIGALLCSRVSILLLRSARAAVDLFNAFVSGSRSAVLLSFVSL